MKREHLLWLAASTAGASPLLQFGQGSTFDYNGLRFGADKKFSITMFSDMHFGEPAWVGAGKGPEADKKTIGVMNSVLDNEHSNLVVLNGDLTSCEFVAPENMTALIDQVTAPLVDRNMPFAATFGNHDMSKTCSTRLMLEHMTNNIKGKNEKTLSFTKSSVAGPYEEVGSSNYYIPVYASSGGGNPQLSLMLYFFDSKGGRDFQKTDANGQDVSVPGWVDDKVTSWFHLTRKAIQQREGRVIPSLAFVHIPPHATRAYQKNGHNPKLAPGINEELIGHQGDVCDSNNKCNYAGTDTPFMQALVETEGLMGVFSGHDHGVDWCMKWSKDLSGNSPANGNGLNFCFNRHTGYGGYSEWTRGGRQITIDETKLGENVLDTWIRLEDGSVSGRVTLNATYGTDVYPVVTSSKSTSL
ncbi:Metallo-dependent phosphatase-like protein [Boeremia exigua]|uniref:Metallo-dependent phosphatase-like protein n=1 Tax=Boeremia exigua TaxID=749465 RepID=UPI001E8E4928|nr:Metallo-dependent phosphatase-like protein [Boeremia exigua]KAH6642834.1 Metallo-dependent phosphatase-like protein [Boeremia exigua]